MVVAAQANPYWTTRVNGAIMVPMNATTSKAGTVHPLERFNLRLPQDTVAAIDSARACRAGNVSRNTWITEAIEEKLRRDGGETNPQEQRRA